MKPSRFHRTPNFLEPLACAWGLIAFSILSGAEVFGADTAAGRKPNVVVIVADDLGYADPGFQGGREIPTPHLDALAKRGTRFTNGYVSCPVCSPTRAGLVTGRYQQRFGHEHNPGGGGMREDFGLPLTESTIANALKSAGYVTGIVGKWHLGSADKFNPLERGFDEFYGFLGGAHPYLVRADQQPILRGRHPVEESEYLTDAIGREAVDFVQRHREKPFYLQVTFNAVHLPLQAPAKYEERFSQISDPKHRTYAAMLSALDDNVGRVLDKLRELKIEDNTLVAFISDNGGPQANTSSNGPLHGHKGSVWEGGIRVPFVLVWPGRIPAGATYDQPVISLDIAATAAAVGGAKLGGEKPVDGVNLLPYVTHEQTGSPHERLYWRFGQQWAIRQGQHKVVKLAGEPAKLFDLTADIGEVHDLAAAQPQRLAELSNAFATWNGELEEPRWKPAPRKNNKQQQARRAQRQAGAN